MATKEDGENASQEGDQRIVDLALKAGYKGTGKGKWGFGKGQSWNEKGSKGSKGGRKELVAERQWQERRRKVAKERRGHVGRAARQDTLQLGAGKEATRICTQ